MDVAASLAAGRVAVFWLGRQITMSITSASTLGLASATQTLQYASGYGLDGSAKDRPAMLKFKDADKNARYDDTLSMDTKFETLSAIRMAVWRELSDATHDKAHAWRTPVLATVSGDAADARVVILREVEEQNGRLRFYTDGRAGKVAQIGIAPAGCLVMWSPTLHWQVRCHARLKLDVSGLAATSRWAKIRLTPAANDYLSNMPPGAPMQDVPDGGSSSGSGAVSRAHFAVVSAEVYRLDWLELAPTGNRRAIFDAEGERWVQP